MYCAAIMGICNQRVSSLLLWILLTFGISHAKVHYKVRCTEDTMQVEVMKTESTGDVYLDQLKDYPDQACHPEVDEHRAVFRLSLKDVFQCGVTRIANQVTGRRAYYHRIVIETKDQNLPKEVILVKCIQAGLHNHTHLVTKRNVLPAGFQEPEFKELELFDMVARAPEPMLGVGVRQGGQLVTGELNVNPGTPLQMEIYLDKGSAPVYGLLVSYMQVSDTKAQEETIIFNGCSVDPYLFENFNTVDGDFLSAKFRAFKFPESTYVQFKGTVNVCLDKCRGVECSNGQLGFGRRKREVPNAPADPNKVFEVTMTTFIKVDYKDDGMLEKGKLGGASVIKSTSEFGKIRNETKIDASSGSSGMTHDGNRLQQLETEEIREEFKYTVVEADRNTASIRLVDLSLFLLMSVFIFH